MNLRNEKIVKRNQTYISDQKYYELVFIHMRYKNRQVHWDRKENAVVAKGLLGGKIKERYCFISSEIPVWLEWVLESDSRDGCPTLWMCLMPKW